MKIISGFNFRLFKTDFKLWHEIEKINFFGADFLFKNCRGKLSRSEKCAPSAFNFFAKAKSFPINIFKARGFARSIIFFAKISRSIFVKSYSRMMIAEFFGRFLMIFSKSEIFLRSVKKTGGQENFFISKQIF